MLSPDLSPHREASLEWWFVQGFFEGKNVERRQFMVSLFRQAASPDIPDGHMLLVSAFDEARKEHTFTSQVSPALIDNFVEEAPKELKNIDISENLVQAYVSEIKRGGAPSPIKQSDDPVTMVSDRLDVGWGELSLSQNDDAINIGFRMPNDGALCEFKLEPQTTWLHEEKQNRFRFESMAYESCPRLAVTGTSNNYPVYGEAWIDHQWGNYGWLKTEDDESEMLGWSWFGINLNNRTDLIVEIRHNLRTGDAVEGFAVHFVPGSDPRVVNDVRLTELRRWTSPKTMVSYPIEWRVEIPSLGVDLTFSPFTDDQEIPVFGVINAIWEGVGLVDGTIDGHAVQGRARLELQG
ncbi:MAG: hypothetical protein K8F25_06895, partial [Fimbriimonadaceae bacterium]|nr:hypothetical protein [Alphaproteobacteria bacterium]